VYGRRRADKNDEVYAASAWNCCVGRNLPRVRAHQSGFAGRKAIIDRNHGLSLVRQAKAMNIGRGSIYYKRRPVSPEDLSTMRRIDELHLDYPFAGSRMLRDFLNRAGVSIGRRHVAMLKKRMVLISTEN